MQQCQKLTNVLKTFFRKTTIFDAGKANPHSAPKTKTFFLLVFDLRSSEWASNIFFLAFDLQSSRLEALELKKRIY